MLFQVNRKGCTRIVLEFKTFVIKIPNFLYTHYTFLSGCLANKGERNLYKNNLVFRELIVPTIYCSVFGLLQIQKKCSPLERHLTPEERSRFDYISGGDLKKENFGYYNNQLVCLDYGKT